MCVCVCVCVSVCVVEGNPGFLLFLTRPLVLWFEVTCETETLEQFSRFLQTTRLLLHVCRMGRFPLLFGRRSSRIAVCLFFMFRRENGVMVMTPLAGCAVRVSIAAELAHHGILVVRSMHNLVKWL